MRSAVQNQAHGGIDGTYNNYDLAKEKRAALDACAAWVLEIAEGVEVPSNLVALASSTLNTCMQGRPAQSHRRLGARFSQAVLAQASRADLDSLGTVSGFAGPVLLMSGACNDWIGAPLQQRHVDLFANALHMEIPDAGHDIVDDQPEAILAALRAFLDRSY